jgi:uncharacterized protein
MRRLMAHALRDRNTPKALAQGRQVIDFEGQLAEFDRLCEIVERDLGALDASRRPANWRKRTLRARLEFGFADVSEQLPVVNGSASVTVPAVCQRCLEPCELALVADIRYLLLAGDSATSASEDYEVWELDEPQLRPADLVEEVLVMALPISAVHGDRSECGALAERIGGEAPQAGETARPFADLRTLMNKTK